MMPLSIDRKPQAKRDAIEIWDYIAPNGPRAAEGMLRRIDKAIKMLAERPEGGRACEELGTGIRSFPVESYRVFYRYSANTLTIVRILHAARDITSDLLAE